MTECDRINDVLSVIGKYFEVTDRMLRSHRRSRDLHRPRQIAMYISHRTSGATNQQIGAAFGNRDHTIVQMHCRAIRQECEDDPEFRELVGDLECEIKRGWLLT